MTYRTSGRGIVINVVTLTLGFMVMLLSSFGALAAFGWLITLTMVTSMLGALFVLPAVLGIAQPGFLLRPSPFRRSTGPTTDAEEVDHEDAD